MLTLMLSDSNQFEKQVLETAFLQHQFVVIPFNPSFQFYVKLIQYSPEIVVIEMPSLCKDQLHFIELMRKYKKFQSTPIIGFGESIDPLIFNHYRKIGINFYLVRPLKISSLIQKFEVLLHKKVISEEKEAKKNDNDFEFLFKNDTLPLKKIEFMADHVSKLMAFPFTATKVANLSSSNNSGAKQLAQIINSDPIISAQILKVSNSVFFASLNRRINSIHDAIVRIGFNETKRIVMSMAVMNIFDKDPHNAGFDRASFWCHSIACAIISEKIAKRKSLVNVSEAFLSGLLHDLGILLMDEYFPSVFSRILNETTESSTEFVEEEKKLLNITHLDFTLELFERWKIPSNISKGIAKKDNFRLIARDMVEESQIGFCIGMAETLSKTLFLGQECDSFVKPIDTETFNIAKLPHGFSGAFIKEVYTELSFYQQFLKLENVDILASRESIKNVNKLKFAIIKSADDLFIPPELYFRKEGAEIEIIDEGELDKINSEFDVAILWCVSNDNIDMVECIANFSRRQSELFEIESMELPVLLLIDEDSALKQINKPQVSILPKSLDMRMFDSVIAEIFEGHKYNYFELTNQNTEKPN